MTATPAPDVVQRAGFLLRGDEPALIVADAGATRMRAASLLKPLLLWAAHALPPFQGEDERWRCLAEPAVRTSDNAAMVEVWDACGEHQLLAALAQRTGIEFAREAGGPRGFGRVLIGAGDVARAYMALADAAGDDAPSRLLAWMRAVPEHQTFGTREAVAQRLGIDTSTVAVKTGWFCDTDELHLRTHAVTVSQTGHATVGTVVLTRVAAPADLRRSYAQTYRFGDEVLPWHEQYAGEALREGTRQAVAALGR